MNAVIIDDEPAGVRYLQDLLCCLPQVKEITTFTNPLEGREYLLTHPTELAFLDIEMPEVSGLDIAQALRSHGLTTAVVFVTGYEQYALEAFRVDAVSYLLKPCEPEELVRAVAKAQQLASRHPAAVVQTFDDFDVFAHGIPIRFSNAKAKELLAVLVDRRGADLTMSSLVNVLWPDRPYDDNVKQLYRKAVTYLNHTLAQYGISQIFSSARGSCHVNPACFSCDYYDFLERKPEALKKFNGRYMFSYSWSEDTLAILEREFQQK